MIVERSETLPLLTPSDVVTARQKVRERAVDIGLSLVEQTKTVTAASELARNAVVYGGGGHVQIDSVRDNHRVGLRLVFADRGPGIHDIEAALKDGYTTGNGLGMGLGGARRLMSDFAIDSRVGEGTCVTVVKWR